MRCLLTLSLLPAMLIPAVGQTRTDTPHIELTADKLTRVDHVLRASGHVRAKVGDISVQADEAVLHSDIGQLEMRGHVQGVLPARSDHHVFRSSESNLVTEKPVTIHAASLIFANGRFTASGNVVLRVVDDEVLDPPQLQADDLSLSLETGDGTLNGNVRSTRYGLPFQFTNRARSFVFPPDIIK